MGAGLPKPVMVQHLERGSNGKIIVGSCSVNGFRESMEDAHVIYSSKAGDFYSVCDGHGGGECSKFIAARWSELLKEQWTSSGVPEMEDIPKWAQSIDDAFLVRSTSAGSTCTGCFVGPQPENDSKDLHVRVMNIGDSRTIVARNGNVVFGTQDHSPKDAGERERIEDDGGFVGAGRVDGSLAVSRAFGDSEFKSNPDPKKRRVNVVPDITDTALGNGPLDFIVIVCDGVLENGAFDNQGLADFITQEIECAANTGDGNVDLAKISSTVCHEAVDRGSKDNISCMILRQCQNKTESTIVEPSTEVAHGAFNAAYHKGFRDAFEAMCLAGEVSVGRVLEDRFDFLVETVAKDRSKEDLVNELEGDFEPMLSRVEKLPENPTQEQRFARTQIFAQWFQTIGKPSIAPNNHFSPSGKPPGNDDDDSSPPPKGGGNGSNPDASPGGAGGPPRVESTPEPKALTPDEKGARKHRGPPGASTSGEDIDTLNDSGIAQPAIPVGQPLLDEGKELPGRVPTPTYEDSLDTTVGGEHNDMTQLSSSARFSVDSMNGAPPTMPVGPTAAGNGAAAAATINNVEKTLDKIRDTLDRSKSVSESIEESQKENEKFEQKWQEFQGQFDKLNSALVDNIAAASGRRGSNIGPAGDDFRIGQEEKAAVFGGKTPGLEHVAEMIKQKKVKNVVFACGAGISTSAGIPDFRSKETGLYAQLQKEKENKENKKKEGEADDPEMAKAKRDWDLPEPESLFDIDFYCNNPMPFVNRATSLWPGDDCAFHPTPAHVFIRLLHEKFGCVRRVFTQNIDGLEKVAGLSAEQLVQCHGSFDGIQCPRCGHRISKYPSTGANAGGADGGAGPRGLSRTVSTVAPRINREYHNIRHSMCVEKKPVICPECNDAPLKPDIVFFGESLPEEFATKIEEDLPQCDLLIVMGTSLQVMPFSQIPSRVSPLCPRVLLNNEIVGTFRDSDDPGNYRDVTDCLGDVDDACFRLAGYLGLQTQMTQLCSFMGSKKTEPSAPRGKKSHTPPPRHAGEPAKKQPAAATAKRDATPTRKSSTSPAATAARKSPPPRGRKSSPPPQPNRKKSSSPPPASKSTPPGKSLANK